MSEEAKDTKQGENNKPPKIILVAMIANTGALQIIVDKECPPMVLALGLKLIDMQVEQVLRGTEEIPKIIKPNGFVSGLKNMLRGKCGR